VMFVANRDAVAVNVTGVEATTLPDLSATLCEPDGNDPTAMTLELNVMWSFVLKRANKGGLWTRNRNRKISI
jgi:hypothetical protein